MSSTSLQGVREDEQAVLAAALTWPEAGAEIVSVLRDEDFATAEGRALFATCQSIREDGAEFSVEEAVARVRALDPQEHPHVVSYTVGVDVHMPSPTGWRSIMARLRNASQLDKLRSEAAGWEQIVTPASMPALRSRLKELSVDFEVGAVEGRHVERWSDVLAGSMEEREKPWSTGYTGLDMMMDGGVRPGEMVVVAGSTSMGKSAQALNIAYRMAAGGCETLFFTLEMSGRDTAHRMLAMDSCVALNVIRRGTVKGNASDWRAVKRSMENLSSIPFTVIDRGMVTVGDIEQRCVLHKTPPVLVVVDYLSLLTPDRDLSQRHLEIGDMTRRLKMLAQERQLCVLLVQQLNRAPAARAGHRPCLADLRESGSIENDANVVLFPWRPSYYEDLEERYEPGAPELEDRLIVAKSRNGRTGELRMKFDGAVMRWNEIDQHAQERVGYS